MASSTGRCGCGEAQALVTGEGRETDSTSLDLFLGIGNVEVDDFGDPESPLRPETEPLRSSAFGDPDLAGPLEQPPPARLASQDQMDLIIRLLRANPGLKITLSLD